jgi:hypothetical protein
VGKINNNIYTVLAIRKLREASQEVVDLIGGPTLNKMDIVCLVVHYYCLYLGPTLLPNPNPVVYIAPTLSKLGAELNKVL